MNILNLHETISVNGGAEVYIGQLQHCLAINGHRSYWLGISEEGSNYSLTFSHKSDKKKGTLKNIVDALQLFVEEKEIDVINIHSLFQNEIVKYCLSSRPVVKFSHSPVMVCPGRDKFWRLSERICDIKYGFHCFRHIYTEGCSNRHPKRVIKAWRHVWFEINYASKRYKKIIVMSDYIKSGLLECGVSERQILLNPYFTPRLANPVPFANNNATKRILFVGRLTSSKGVHLLIEAVADILSKDKNVYLDIVGDGLMKDQLILQVKESNLCEQVIFHGWQGREQINTFLSNCFMVVFPSIYPEAFGIVGIEAMMHGKPVVAFDVGGVSTWLEDSQTGFLIERGNVSAMAGQIKRILDDSVLYRTMSCKAYEAAMARFAPDIHIQLLLDLYRSCLS